jgi:hypothetical protein
MVLFISPQIALADHASASFETGAAGAIMTTPGATLPAGLFVFGVNAQYIELEDIPDSELEALGAADEDVHSVDHLVNLRATLAYGFTDDLTIGISLPYIVRNHIREAHKDAGVGEAEFAGDSEGMGDINLFGQYRFYHDEARDLAILAGIKAPSGDTRERELEGGLFETEQQPGSGSWDPFIGIAFNHSLGMAGVSANVLYTHTAEGSQQTDLGNIINYNLALNYRAYSPEGGHNHHRHHHAFNILDYVDLVLELNGDARGKDDIDGADEAHSGGHIVYISPGIRMGLGHRWSVFGSVGIPVVNDQNGQQSDPDYRIIGGISTTF